ncbi:MAG: glutamate racemase [Breznakia sp.]
MSIKNASIAIFDSGLGGISVLRECMQLLPNEHFLYFGDSINAPYGTKDKKQILDHCFSICNFFMEKQVKAIVVACNTATSVAIDALRQRYPIPIIGMEPALKLAAHNQKKKNIIVMATPLTLKEKKFAKLMKQYETNNNIIKMPCPHFVDIIEQDMDHKQLHVNAQIDAYSHLIKNIDSIVLGCTHFLFLKKEIQHYFDNNIVIFDGNLGTARNLKAILESKNLLSHHTGGVQIYNSDVSKIKLSKKLAGVKV